MSKFGVDYHPVLRPDNKFPVGMAMDAAPRRRLARDEAEAAPRVGLADQVAVYLDRFGAEGFLRYIVPESRIEEVRQALADYSPEGEDDGGRTPEEIERAAAMAPGRDGLGLNDADRPAGTMPANAMDAAIKMTPTLAGIRVGDDFRSLHQHAGRRASTDEDFSTATLARATEIAPGLANIKIGV